MRVVISGATGLIGSALTEHLRTTGHDVVRLVRQSPSGNDVVWDPAAGSLPDDALAGAHAVVHLAGAGIGDHRWTDRYKQEVRDSRVTSTRLLADRIVAMRAAGDGPEVLVSGSAVGYYGNRGDEVLDETSNVGAGFLADVCREWEAAAEPAAKAGARVARIRTGVVLTPDGGALKKLLPLFKLALGGRFSKGTQWQSWITLDDEVGAITHLLGADIEGPVNLTAPEPVTNAEFTSTLADVLGRPAFLPVPKFAPSLLLGGELAQSLLYDGQRVVPKVLEGSGYVFAHPALEPALRAVLSR